MPKQRWPKLWIFVRLVVDHPLLGIDAVDLRTEHTRRAFCLKCQDEIKFSNGNLQMIYHMETQHSADLAAFESRARVACNHESHDKLRIAAAMAIDADGNVLKLHEQAGHSSTDSIPSNHPRANQRSSSRASRYAEGSHRCRVQPNLAKRRRTLQDEQLNTRCGGTPRKAHGGGDRYRVIELSKPMEVDRALCTIFLRDGASNGVRACDQLAIHHMSCVAHSLHLVIAAGLANLKEDRTSVALVKTAKWDAEIEEAVGEKRRIEIDVFVEQASVYRHDLDTVREVVQMFRRIASYFHRSQKGARRIAAFQKRVEKPLVVLIDSPTRWSSTYKTLL
ncbi:hypothetical protein PybrP1_010891 [[Pythium] brassicae (nom. inval.)]|nr:hypothetical protein PybrP1_010891 [[Pythium] brassicae (nom. inval.)]